MRDDRLLHRDGLGEFADRTGRLAQAAEDTDAAPRRERDSARRGDVAKAKEQDRRRFLRYIRRQVGPAAEIKDNEGTALRQVPATGRDDLVALPIARGLSCAERSLLQQLWGLGLPRILAESFADLVDWHAVAELVARGCSPELALEIVR